MASLKRVQNFISDAFSFVNQEHGRTPLLVMDALDETGDVAGPAIPILAGAIVAVIANVSMIVSSFFTFLLS